MQDAEQATDPRDPAAHQFEQVVFGVAPDLKVMTTGFPVDQKKLRDAPIYPADPADPAAPELGLNLRAVTRKRGWQPRAGRAFEIPIRLAVLPIKGLPIKDILVRFGTV
jgi:hypothetical protein